MQKGRILLLLIIFPLFSSVTIFFLRDYEKPIPPKVLAARIVATQTPTPSPTIIISSPSASITKTPTLKPTILPTRILPNSSYWPTDYILEQINNYRKQKGLSQVTSNTETCNFAKTRAEEISHSFTHDGFNKRVNDKNLPYPTYHTVTENIAYNTDYTDVVNRWIASPGHEENIRKDTPFICIARYGDYYTFEGWNP